MSHDRMLARLRERLGELRRKENRVALLEGLARFVALSLAGSLVIAGLDWLLRPDGLGRWVMSAAMWIVVVLLARKSFVLPLARVLHLLPSVDDIELARRVGERFPEIRDRLANVIQLTMSRDSNQSEALVEAALRTLYEAQAGLDFAQIIDTRKLIRAGRQAAGVVLATIVLFFLFTPSLSLSYARLWAPHRSFQLPSSLVWHISPRNTQALQGESVEVEVTVESSATTPSRITLYTRSEGSDQVTSEILYADSAHTFRTTLMHMRQTVQYFAEAEDPVLRRASRSDEYTITVEKRPTVKRLEVEIEPPAYSGLSAQVLDENAGDITALKGSRIRIRTEATKPLRASDIVFSDSTRILMTLGEFAPNRSEGQFTLLREGSYHLSFTDVKGIASSNPVEYRMSIVSDDDPMIQLLDPEKDTDITESMQIRLLADLRDDFGLTRLLLHHRLDKTSSFRETQKDYTVLDLSYLLDRDLVQQSVSYVWNYASLALQPEDVMSFYLEVFDNDVVSGPKSSRSAVITMRFPSLEEILAEVNNQQDQAILKADELLKESESLSKELDELQQELLKDKKLEWQDKEKAKELAAKQEKLQQEMKDIQESLQEMADKMSEHDLLSKETLDKYQELQKLMQDIQSQELQDAIRKMQEAMKKNLNLDQLKNTIKNFKLDQEQFQKNLERTVELLKRLKIEQTFEQLKKQAEELGRRQDQLNELAKQPLKDHEREALAKEQKSLENGLDRLQQESEKQKEAIRQLDPQASTKQLDEAIDRMKSRATQKKMQASQESLSQKQQQESSDQQNRDEIAQELDSLASQLSGAQQEYLEQQNRAVMTAMQKIIYDLLEVSKDQESVMDETGLLHALNPKYRLMTQRQSEVLANMGRVTENIIGLSNRTFHIGTPLGKIVGSALGNMNTAVKEMEERNATQVGQRQMSAMNDVNDAVKMLLQSMNQMQQGASGTGLQSLLQQLEQMAGQQGDVNSGMEQLFGNGGNEGSLSLDQQAELGRRLAEQEAVRRSLENLQNQSEEHGQLKNQLDQMGKEMDEVLKDMQHQDVNRKTLERQRRILQRMLDATKSMQEKDYSEKRKSETGKEYDVRSPKDLPEGLLDRKARLREELLRLKREGYSKDYEELVRKYFEALGDIKQ